MAYTDQQIKEKAIAAPLTGFVATTGTPLPTDSVLVGIEKNAGNLGQVQVQIGTQQVSDNLFKYYNFK